METKIPDHAIEMIGKKYNSLTVLSFSKKIYVSGRRRYMMNCQCDCGNLLTARTDSVKAGNKKSCGCVKRSKSIGFHNPKHRMNLKSES